jgi:hypothetical protein
VAPSGGCDGGAEVGAAIGRSVVAHAALGDDAEAGEPGHGALLALVGRQFSLGEARGIVDGDVQVLPAGAAVADHAAAMAGDAMTVPVDAAELPGVDVDRFAGRSRS